MIKADGIWAFHGTMIYSPLNPKFRKEVKGDFVHRFFDRDGNVCNGFSPDSDVQGYWYDGWSSYDDRFCEIHEEPSARQKSKTELEPGMIVTIEPGIYLENRLGVRIEDLVLITTTGCEVLSHSAK